MIDMPGLDGHSGDHETLTLLYALVRYIKPALIVEAGTYMGHATVTMAHALKEGKIDGEIWTADIYDYGAKASVERNGFSEYVKFFDGDFTDMLEGPLKDRKYRMAFVDSGPSCQVETAVDVRHRHALRALESLAPSGLMVVDDAAGDWSGVEEIRKLGIYLPTGRGLVLVQR